MNDATLSPFFERLPIGAYRSTLDGRQLRANAALVRLNGYDSEAELLVAVRDIASEWYVDPSRRAEFARLLARDGQVVDFVSEVHRHRTRERIWVRETAHLVHDAEGRPAYYEGTVQDITAEHLAHQALNDRERRFRALTDRAQVLTLVCAADARVLYASQAARPILGRDPQALIGECLFDWLHPDEMKMAVEAFEEVVQRRNPGSESLIRLRHADGSWRQIAALGQNYVDDPAVGGIVLNYRDVTERERALRAAKLSQHRMQAAFAAGPDALIISRLADGTYLEVNDTFLELSGYTRDELIGRTSVELNIWASAEARAAFIDEFQRHGRVRHFVAPYQGRGERRGVVDISSERIEVDGESCLLSISRDITDQLETRRALEVSEARLRLALQAANQGLFDLDLDTGVMVVSAEYARLLGHDPAGFAESRKAWYERMHPEDRERVQEQVRGYLRGSDAEFRIEYRQRHRDGHWLGILLLGRRVGVPDAGGSQRLLGTCTDITRRMQAEQALRALASGLEQRVAERTRQLTDSERRYRRIFELAPTAIIEEDWRDAVALLLPHRQAAAADPRAWLRERPELVSQCLQAVRVVHMNPAAIELYGLGPGADAPGRLAELFAAYDNSDGFADELASLLAGHSRHDQARELRRADGQWRHVQLALALPALDPDGDGIALAGLVDVTELRRLSAALDASLTAAQRANRELETFTYSVAHDLKAPLRGLDGYSQMLLQRQADRLDDEGREFLQHIRTAARQMGQLTDDLLAYSRLERSEQVLGAQLLPELVQSVLGACAAELQGLGIVPEVAVPPLAVLADGKAFTVALRNLVDNAIKFSARSVSPQLAIGARARGDKVQLWVRDNGVGFDMSFHDRIFQIFQRLQRAEDYPGTGIGLAMVAKAMDRMGGRVWAESAPGQGATFHLELPRA
jgi:PAS domain S-box-containing protein